MKRKAERRCEFVEALELMDPTSAKQVLSLVMVGVANALRHGDSVCLEVCEHLVLNFAGISFCEDGLGDRELAKLVSDGTQIGDLRRWTKDETRVSRLCDDVSARALHLLRRSLKRRPKRKRK